MMGSVRNSRQQEVGGTAFVRKQRNAGGWASGDAQLFVRYTDILGPINAFVKLNKTRELVFRTAKMTRAPSIYHHHILFQQEM